MEEYVRDFLEENNFIPLNDLQERNLEIVYNLYKNDYFDPYKEYDDVVYNYIGIYFNIKKDYDGVKQARI